MTSPFLHPFENSPDPQKESQQIQQIADLTVDLLKKRYPDGQEIFRGVHAKSHGCVRAQFQVVPDLGEEFQVGIFSKPGKTFESWIRFSNAAVLVEPDLKDGKNGSRGMAIKVLNGEGEFLFDDNGQKNQDFLMINTPAFAFANVEDYLRLTQVLVQHNDDPSAFFAPLQVPVEGVTEEQKQRIAKSAGVLQKIQSIPVANPLEVSYFGASPYLFGDDRVMQFAVRPSGEEKVQVLPESPSDDYLNEALTASMTQNEQIKFDFRVQVTSKENLADLHIEDATAAWDWEDSNSEIQTIAQITIPCPQPDIDTPAHLQECEDRFFTPWHSHVDHRPLGGINRLRKAVYFASAQHRGVY